MRFELPDDVKESVPETRDPLEIYREMMANGDAGAASDRADDLYKADAEGWERQIEPYACAIACQCNILRSFTGRDVSQAAQLGIAEKNDWYDENSGTCTRDFGKVLENAGIETRRERGATTEDMRRALAEGDKLITTVNTHLLYDAACAYNPMMKVNHAVMVVGFEGAGGDAKAVLNDPDRDDGSLIRVPLKQFELARSVGNDFLMTAVKPKNSAGVIQA